MAIKNPDGTPYRLQSPNKIMKTQQPWNDKEKVVVHNMTAEEEEEKPKPEIKIAKPKKKIEPKKEAIIEKLNEVKKSAYCLPAKYEEYTDTLYNEIKKRLTYGSKFVFEIVPIKEGDLTYEFWSDKDISTGSIILVFGERRWWKVVESKDKVFTCYPSDLTPSFEE